mgnify:CR=1 FL=1
MPRKLTGTMALEALRQEVRFTRAALKADPDACDLLSETDAWSGQVTAMRDLEDGVQDAEADADACFAVANQRLDRSCIRFANAKLVSLGMDRSSSQFTRYFKVPPSDFVRQPLADQRSAVEGWLTVTEDSVLEAHRPELSTWSGKGLEALSMMSAQSQCVATHRTKRETLAAVLTSARDALHRSLAGRADALSLGREWPDTFFKKEGARPAKATPSSTAEPASPT